MSTSTHTVKLSAEFGIAPVGAETHSWDWAENEDGFKTRYEFDIIPDEAITVTSEWAERFLVSTLAALHADRPEAVVRFTASADTQPFNSFVGSTWMRYSEALELLTAFLDGLK